MNPIECASYDLLSASVSLSTILDQPVDERGVMKIKYDHASRLINELLISVNNAVGKLNDLAADLAAGNE